MKWFEKYHIERVLIICSEGIYVPVAFVPEKLLPYKGVTFSEYNRKASIICPKKWIIKYYAKDRKGKTDRGTYKQTDRKTENEREDTSSVSLYVSVWLIPWSFYLL